MTTAIALHGQWEGLRAFPRGFRTLDHRHRVQAALERLERLRDEMHARADALIAGARRAEGLAAGMIDQLDAIDGDSDVEPDGSDELYLSAVEGVITIGGTAYVLSQERVAAWEPFGGEDREEEDEHDEASLCGVTFGPGDALDPETDLSWGGEYEGTDQRDLRTAPEGDADPDREPSLTTLDRHGGDQCGGRWIAGVTSDDREADTEDGDAEAGQ